MTKQEISEQYQIDENGVITSPGKFEREMYYAVSFWGDALDGFSNSEEYLEDGTVVAVFEINKPEIEEFPELIGNTILKIWEDDNGFVFCVVD
jgi:hypothetical protein